MNIAAILAGGTGSRMGADMPKQFLTINNRTVIELSIDAFDQAEGIDAIVVVVHPEWLDYMNAIVARNQWSKVQRVVCGGKERYMSSLQAIQAYGHAPAGSNIILHDAARPFVSQAVIGRVLQALATHQAVGVGVPSTDTVWQLHPTSPTIAAIPDRAVMYRAQTPQAFRLDLIAEAYRRALADPAMQATDDCGVVLRYMPEVPVAVVLGDEQNKKITFKQDLL